jgi:hypothetical protein
MDGKFYFLQMIIVGFFTLLQSYDILLLNFEGRTFLNSEEKSRRGTVADFMIHAWISYIIMSRFRSRTQLFFHFCTIESEIGFIHGTTTTSLNVYPSVPKTPVCRTK